MAPSLRQTSTMRSTKLLVLEAIRRHLFNYGCSPSYGELRAMVGVEPPRISAIVRQLTDEGQIVRQAGPRGLALPRRLANFSMIELLLELQERGLVVKVSPATSPLASGTIQQLSDNPTIDHLLQQLDEVAKGGKEAERDEQAGDHRRGSSQPHA